MDGNRRFARLMGMEVHKGHRCGLNKLMEVIEMCQLLGIKVITVYAFSLQNFQRSETEVNNIINLATETAKSRLQPGHKQTFAIKFHGDMRFLPEYLRKTLQEAEELSDKLKTEDQILVNVCVSYGGRNEIARAKEKIANIPGDRTHEEEAKLFYSLLVGGEYKPPEILIRTSGVTRLSDFLIYQCSEFTTFYFLHDTWPELSMWSLIGTLIHWTIFCGRKSTDRGYTIF
uniref:Alkyl transferase n=2 Tax=Babesia bovis TaxID=5865 RepID=A7AVK2_BABBO|eukprot:XP_001609396.1 undecaprenyl pyrophosphate synthetase [Babesia bovis T2Bo]